MEECTDYLHPICCFLECVTDMSQRLLFKYEISSYSNSNHYHVDLILLGIKQKLNIILIVCCLSPC